MANGAAIVELKGAGRTYVQVDGDLEDGRDRLAENDVDGDRDRDEDDRPRVELLPDPVHPRFPPPLLTSPL